MTISMYAASIPLLKHNLKSLAAVLAKAEAHAMEKKIAPSVLLDSRLYPDMFPLTRQVQIATDHAKGCAARLSGSEIPKYEDTESSFADLAARIAKTISFLDSVRADQIDGSEEREIALQAGPRTMEFKGQAYLTNWVLPNFFFHVTTAYAILRHNGVELSKADFLGM